MTGEAAGASSSGGAEAVSASASAGPAVGPDESNGAEVAEDLDEQFAEAGQMLVRRKPHEPTQRERDEHEALHEPYTSWCKFCVGGRGISDKHAVKDTDESALAKVGFDYGYLAVKEDGTPIVCGKDSKHRWFFAIPVPCKGVEDKWSERTVAQQISWQDTDGLLWEQTLRGLFWL